MVSHNSQALDHVDDDTPQLRSLYIEFFLFFNLIFFLPVIIFARARRDEPDSVRYTRRG